MVTPELGRGRCSHLLLPSCLLCLNELLLVSRSVVSNSFAAPWTVAHQAPLFVGFPRQITGSRLPFPSLGDLPDPGIKPIISCTCQQILYH